MRALVLLLACAACVTTAHEVTEPQAGQALVAGRFVTPRTRVDRTLRLRGPGAEEIHVRLEHATWLVALPPGRYEVHLLGRYAPKDGPLRFEARAGAARYLGTFVFGKLRDGDLPVEIEDQTAAVAAELRQRHASVPELEPALVGKALVLRSQAAAYDPSHYRHGFYFSRSRQGRRAGRR